MSSYCFQHIWTKDGHRLRFRHRFNIKQARCLSEKSYFLNRVKKQWVVEKSNADLRCNVTVVIIQVGIWTKEPQSAQFNYIYFIFKFIFVYNCRRDYTKKLTCENCLQYSTFLLFLSSKHEHSNQDTAVPVVSTFNKCCFWCFHYLMREHMIHRISNEWK